MKLLHLGLIIGSAFSLASCQSPSGSSADSEMQLRAEVQEMRSEIVDLKKQLEEQNAGQTEAILVEHLAELNGELDALKLQMTDHHPKMIAMKGEISTLETLLSERSKD